MAAREEEEKNDNVEDSDVETDAALTATRAAGYLGFSRSTLLRLESRGHVSSWRTPGGHRRYSLESLRILRRRLQETRADSGSSPLCVIEIGDDDEQQQP